jgi:hypothetical protein
MSLSPFLSVAPFVVVFVRAAMCRVYQDVEQLYNNLTLGYHNYVNKTSEAARALARRSVAARRQKWGAKGFRKRMRCWGKLGGRPRTKKGKRHAN